MSTEREFGNMLNENVKAALPSKPKKPKKLRVASLDDLKKLRDALPKSLNEGAPAKVKGVKP